MLFEQEMRGADQPGEGQRRRRSSWPRTWASSSSTRSTRSSPAKAAAGPTSRGRACSATCCRSSKARPCKTRYGYVRTDHMLFIAAGAFHTAKPSDLMPELQGRFPIRVELKDLTKDDFVRILTEPKNSLTRQYTALLKTEGVDARLHRRRDRRAGRLRLPREPDDAEHRRPPAVHDPGAAARRALASKPPTCSMGHVEINAAYVKRAAGRGREG